MRTKGSYLGDLEEVVLLAVVRCEPEAYGMRIRREIEGQSGRKVAIGAVYASLERLEDKGLVRLAEPPPDDGRDGRPRRFFSITQAGRRALQETAAVRDSLWRGLKLNRGGRPS
ncbi:MAG TPA: helix-turn-helix transcriptional regulator [Vicinamibacterales bacterium]|jgi:PadR family transcriptional regulator PadR|nr:helix-turn-helix transcriptional regulator [Vicinamibacterales bacterium]